MGTGFWVDWLGRCADVGWLFSIRLARDRSMRKEDARGRGARAFAGDPCIFGKREQGSRTPQGMVHTPYSTLPTPCFLGRRGTDGGGIWRRVNSLGDAALPGGRDFYGGHAGGGCGLNAHVGVFKDQAAGWRDAEFGCS